MTKELARQRQNSQQQLCSLRPALVPPGIARGLARVFCIEGHETAAAQKQLQLEPQRGVKPPRFAVGPNTAGSLSHRYLKAVSMRLASGGLVGQPFCL